MRFRTLSALVLLGTAACSGATDDGTTDAKAKAAAAETDKAGYDIALRCQANFDAVARLYSALSSQSEGAERDELAAIASERQAAASRYRDIAKKVGKHIGHADTDVDGAIKAADALVEAEYTKRPFEDFASWVAGEADKCPPPST